jgi:hypothetical protein
MDPCKWPKASAAELRLELRARQYRATKTRNSLLVLRTKFRNQEATLIKRLRKLDARIDELHRLLELKRSNASI